MMQMSRLSRASPQSSPVAAWTWSCCYHSGPAGASCSWWQLLIMKMRTVRDGAAITANMLEEDGILRTKFFIITMITSMIEIIPINISMITTQRKVDIFQIKYAPWAWARYFYANFFPTHCYLLNLILQHDATHLHVEEHDHSHEHAHTHEHKHHHAHDNKHDHQHSHEEAHKHKHRCTLNVPMNECEWICVDEIMSLNRETQFILGSTLIHN